MMVEKGTGLHFRINYLLITVLLPSSSPASPPEGPQDWRREMREADKEAATLSDAEPHGFSRTVFLSLVAAPYIRYAFGCAPVRIERI